MKALDDLKRSLAWRLFPWTNLQLELGPGCTVVLRNRGDFLILREIFIEGEYDPFIAKIGPVANWLDLGCNCGMFSLLMESTARKNGWAAPRQAVLIDANAEALSAARDAIAISKPETKLELVEAAVGPRGVATIDFYEGKTSHKSRLTSLGSRGKKVTRPVADLDKLAAKLGEQIDLVKIDIEGAEAILLEHWGDWLAAKAKHLLIEWHEPEQPGLELKAKLEKLGFAFVDASSEKGQGEIALSAHIGTALFSRA
ncbi:FkbM family methyltransferase [Cerasicoccus fimbriatus]|uniref:FkbM family methyltransferase n=1 Tax=Cerasicoccus fimbriatus TaxID=3014554 RepID=UPI0022B5B47B|nr:FkbM family methyltransferase [Cerasicoccus sp. TK19100]